MTGHATRFDPANRATEHTPAGCGEESPRSYRGVGNRNGVGSAAVLGRINPMTGRAPASITQIRRPIFDRLGAAKNRRAPIEALGTATAPGARPSSAASTRRPIVYLLQSRKSDDRSLTGWVRRRIAALPRGVGQSNRAGH